MNDNQAIQNLRKIRRNRAFAIAGLMLILAAAIISFFDPAGKPLRMGALFVFFAAILSPFMSRSIRAEKQLRKVSH
jgi:uncharacterized membrane protein